MPSLVENKSKIEAKFSYLYDGEFNLNHFTSVKKKVMMIHANRKKFNLSACYASGIRNSFNLINFEFFPISFYEKYKNDALSEFQKSLRPISSSKYIIEEKKQNSSGIILTNEQRKELSIYFASLNLDFSDFEEKLDYIYQFQLKKNLTDEENQRFKKRMIFEATKGCLEETDNLTQIFDLKNMSSDQNSGIDSKRHDLVYSLKGDKKDVLYFTVRNFKQNQGVTKVSEFIKKIITQETFECDKKKRPLSGIIIDIRDNSGGYLNLAQDLISIFSPTSKIYTLKFSYKGQEDVYPSEEKITDLPLAVIVNEKTSSGAEIFAGSLQQNNRAMVIGKKTAGLGSIQMFYDLENKQEFLLKITSATILLPNGIELQGNGITPDFIISHQSSFESKDFEWNVWNQLRPTELPKNYESKFNIKEIKKIHEWNLKNKKYQYIEEEKKSDLFLAESLEYFQAFLEWKKAQKKGE